MKRGQTHIYTSRLCERIGLTADSLKRRCTVYLSYDTLVAYVPVLMAEQFQIPCRVISNGFLAENEQTGLYWFLLSQTFNQKYTDFEFFVSKNVNVLDVMMAASLKDTGSQLFV